MDGKQAHVETLLEVDKLCESSAAAARGGSLVITLVGSIQENGVVALLMSSLMRDMFTKDEVIFKLISCSLLLPLH